MKIAVAQMAVVPGHPDVNVQKIVTEIEKARSQGCALIVFPEMAVPGYLLGDEWENAAFVNDCFAYNEVIKDATKGIAAIWGNVFVDDRKRGEDGRVRKYNAAFVAQNGLWVSNGHVFKTLMPKYREFDDERHFYSLRKDAADQGLPIETLLQPF